MTEESKKMFDMFVSEILVPIIVKDKDIVDFINDNNITDQNQIMNIVCWLASSTIVKVFEKNRTDANVIDIYNLAVQFKKSCGDELSKDFDDIEEILTDVLNDNVIEWGEEIINKAVDMAKQPAEKTGKTGKKLVFKKTNTPKKENKEETNQKIPPKILKTLVDMQIKAYKQVITKNKFFTALAKKFPKIPKKDLAEYVGCAMLSLVLSFSAKKGFKGMEGMADYFEQIDHEVLLRAAKVYKKFEKLVGKNSKKFNEQIVDFLDKHSKEIADEQAKIMAKLQKEMEK